MTFVDFSQPKLYDPSNLLDSITKIRSLNQTQDDQQTDQAAGALASQGDWAGAANVYNSAGKLQAGQNALNYGQTAARRAAYSNYANDPEKLGQELLKTGDPEAYANAMKIKAQQEEQAAWRAKGEELAAQHPDDPKTQALIRSNPQAYLGVDKAVRDANTEKFQTLQSQIGPHLDALLDARNEKDPAERARKFHSILDAFDLFDRSGQSTAIYRNEEKSGTPVDQILDGAIAVAKTSKAAAEARKNTKYYNGPNDTLIPFGNGEFQTPFKKPDDLGPEFGASDDTTLIKNARAFQEAWNQNPEHKDALLAWDMALEHERTKGSQVQVDPKSGKAALVLASGGAQGKLSTRANDVNSSLAFIKDTYGLEPSPQMKAQLVADKTKFPDVSFDDSGKPSLFVNSISNPVQGAARIAEQQTALNKQWNKDHAADIASGAVAARPEEIGQVYKDLSGKLTAQQNANTRQKQVDHNTDPNAPGSIASTRVPQTAQELAIARGKGASLGKYSAEDIRRQRILLGADNHFSQAEKFLDDPDINDVLGPVYSGKTYQDIRNAIDSGRVKAPANWGNLQTEIDAGAREFVNAYHLPGTGQEALGMNEGLKADIEHLLWQSPNREVLRQRLAGLRGISQGFLSTPTTEELANNKEFQAFRLQEAQRALRNITQPNQGGLVYPAPASGSATPAAKPEAPASGVGDDAYAKWYHQRTGKLPPSAQTSAPAQAPAPAAQEKPAEAQSAAPSAPKQVTSKEEFDALPSGTVFIAPDGSKRRKP
jgi:hypothetical protein